MARKRSNQTKRKAKRNYKRKTKKKSKDKKIKVTSSMKKEMIKTLQDAMKSKYKNSEEVDILKRNGERLSNVLSWVKRL